MELIDTTHWDGLGKPISLLATELGECSHIISSYDKVQRALSNENCFNK